MSSDSWEIKLGEKPLIAIIKLVVGGVVSFSGTSKITSEIIQTKQAIAQTYQQIKSSEGLSFQLPDLGISFLVLLSAIALLGIFLKGQNNDNKN
jgi:hypothetical protein